MTGKTPAINILPDVQENKAANYVSKVTTKLLFTSHQHCSIEQRIDGGFQLGNVKLST